tara:strand:+ start:384 stop:575 length:192 start_codon:yes stop_codon:yes gene_type:complete
MTNDKEKLKTICAWCNKLIHEGKTLTLFGKERVSHGMCKTCYDNMDDIQERMMDGEKFPPERK